MTPRPLSSSGTQQPHTSRSPPTGTTTITTGDQDHRTQHPPTYDSPSEPPEEEARPSHTAEIGTLKKLSVPGGTAWLGSSSGVYFVNTVRRAFSAAFASNSHTPLNNRNNADADVDDASDPEIVPPSEDIITGEDAAGRNVNGGLASGGGGRNAWWLGGGGQDADFHRRIVAAVGRPPADRRLAMELVTVFFSTTHPLFPFLHGPTFLEDMDEIYAALGQQARGAGAGAGAGAGIGGNNNNNTGFSPHAKQTYSTASSSTSNDGLGNLHTVDPLKLITFQIIINIAALSHHSATTGAANAVPALPTSSTIPSSQALLTLILPLSTNPLLPTIQLLLSAELYLLSTISLRQSSSLAGLVLRLIYHAGLHRCPLRYASLTPQDCEIRKRVFWSAYALDRHLSLALGDPNTFQDSDIDVCLSRDGDGEMHRAVARDFLTEEERENEMRLHYPRDASGRRVLFSSASGPSTAKKGDEDRRAAHASHFTYQSQSQAQSLRPHPPDADPTQPCLSPRTKQLREAALTAYVHYGKLTGRIIEIFHKSINLRFPKDDAIDFLSADIENWWNDLPSTLTGAHCGSGSGAGRRNGDDDGDDGSGDPAHLEDDLIGVSPGLIHQHRMLTPFFAVLYHQLLLLLNRPRLSLDQATAQFQQGLQVCIRASRNTLSALKKHKENGQSMFLPGLLSAAWMSGLIIAFACQLGKTPKKRACSDIRSCLLLLESMNTKWYTVKNCHKVLSLLLANIMSRKAASNGNLPAGRNDAVSHAANTSQPNGPSLKRTRDSNSLDNSEAEPSPKRDSIAGTSPASSDFRPLHFRSPNARSNALPVGQATADPLTAGFLRQDSITSNASFDFPTQHPASSSFQTMDFNNGNNNPGPANSTESLGGQQRAGAALYADPQDMAFAQSSHSMGFNEMSTDDQMFWSNMDSNLFDVFGAVSWETMTGPAGPMASNPNAWDVSSAFENPGAGNDVNMLGNGRFM